MTEEVEAAIGHTPLENPFEITKAVDFTDPEIDATWVDWPAPGGFAGWFDIRSPMARIIRGGKGTGRTHIMRHFSVPLQVIRGGGKSIEQVQKDGVLGVYARCSGLNSSRFHGRGIDDQRWQFIFSYFADVWLAQMALQSVAAVTAGQRPSADVERAIVKDIHGLLENGHEPLGESLAELGQDLYRIQRRVELAVNNAALNPDGHLDFSIQSSPGELVFGIPQALQHHYKPLRNVTFLYLIDEFENIDKPQQQYINSLVREKRIGTSFMIGVRTDGLKTLSTLGSGEENKHGSEFEEISPDRVYAVKEKRKYEEFCHRVIARRLSRSGLIDELDRIATPQELKRLLEGFFVRPAALSEERLMAQLYEPEKRPYLDDLRDKLSEYGEKPNGTPLSSEEVEFVIEAVRVPSRPLLEKVNVLLIFRAWSSGRDITKAAREIQESGSPVDPKGVVRPNSVQKSILSHYSSDLQAQLWGDMRRLHLHRSQTYVGLDKFIRMSDGLPRNLIVILKNIHRWAQFNGEQPFKGEPISLQSQFNGVIEASEWFLADAKPMGEDGDHVVDAINRLGEMFRRFRFSDKPVECSLCTFSADLTTCSIRAREVIELARQKALLVRIDKGQKERNSRLTEDKFQLNPLLSPKWHLPISRRGAIRLNAEEVNTVFDPAHSGEFQNAVDIRLGRMDAPFSRVQNSDRDARTAQQTLAFDGFLE